MASETTSKRNRRLMMAVASLLVATALAWWFWPREVRPVAITTADGRTIRLEDGELPSPMSQGPMKEYFDATTPEARRAILDRLIDEQERLTEGLNLQPGTPMSEADADRLAQRMAEGAPGTTDGSPAQPRRVMMGTGGMGRSLPPSDQARISEFAKALSDRRKERGLSPHAPIIIRRGPGS